MAEKMLILGYQYSATGIFGCEYYENGEKKCTISSIVTPNAPITMRGWKLSWRTDFDREITIIPGQRLPIVDDESERKVAEIITLSFSNYVLSCKSEEITVAEEQNTLVFCKEGKTVATCRRAGQNEAPPINLYGEPVRARYAVELSPDCLSAEMMLLILSFPGLGLGIPTRNCFCLCKG